MENTTQSIKDLWLLGLTGREIANQLKTTRNAVLGKIYRMRESGEIGIREADMRMHNIRIETKKLESERVVTITGVMRESPMEKETPEKPIEDILIFEQLFPKEQTTQPVKFDKLTPKSCRFVLNDGLPENFLFCGKPKKGRSYCKDHEALCYHRIERKGKK